MKQHLFESSFNMSKEKICSAVITKWLNCSHLALLSGQKDFRIIKSHPAIFDFRIANTTLITDAAAILAIHRQRHFRRPTIDFRTLQNGTIVDTFACNSILSAYSHLCVGSLNRQLNEWVFLILHEWTDIVQYILMFIVWGAGDLPK